MAQEMCSGMYMEQMPDLQELMTLMNCIIKECFWERQQQENGQQMTPQMNTQANGGRNAPLNQKITEDNIRRIAKDKTGPQPQRHEQRKSAGIAGVAQIYPSEFDAGSARLIDVNEPLYNGTLVNISGQDVLISDEDASFIRKVQAGGNAPQGRSYSVQEALKNMTQGERLEYEKFGKIPARLRSGWPE